MGALSSEIQPKVSIIIPIYNNEVYLEQCITSLLNQTLNDIEIICVNDGSTDNSLSIVETFMKQDSRVKLINQKNQGQSVARNKGRYLARGEYVAFIDSDDYAKPNMFEKLYNNAIKYKADITMCSVTTLNAKTMRFSDNDTYHTMSIFPEKFDDRAFLPEETFEFLFRISVAPWNKIYKRDFLQKNNIIFQEGLYFEDNLYFLEVYLSAKSISLIRDNLIVYRTFSENSTINAAKNDSKKLDLFKIMKLEEELLKRKNLYKELSAKFKKAKYNTLVYWYKKISNPWVKFRYRIKFFMEYPFKNTEFL